MLDLNKIRGYAQKQREQDNASGETFKEPSEELKESAAEIDDEIYIPTDDEEDIGPIPDEYYEAQAAEADSEDKESMGDTIERCFPEKAYNIDIERLLSYRKNIFSIALDESIIKDINRRGITEPLLVRSIGNGEYEVLSGARRRAAAESLSWTKVPCRIADNDILTDDMADMIVVQSNRQRFSELTMSETVRVSAVLGDDSEKELKISAEQVKKYILLNGLVQPLLLMLDDNSLPLAAAEILAGLPQSTQRRIYDTASGSALKITPANAAELAKAKRLTEDNIVKILTAKPKPAPKVVVPPEVVEKYLSGKTAKEAEEVIEQALAAYLKEVIS